MLYNYLEFIVVGIGLILLMWEAFASPKNKATLGLVGAAGLAAVLVLLIIGSCGSHAQEAPAWMSRFYGHDHYSAFFKGFALISTILVLLMSIDFQSVLNKFTSPDGSDENVGEFYCLPLFACAGLMWMASAKDLVSIFVALELVTISFYVMVTYMRRNVGSLEAGAKYLILGALSTGFLVYGIAWVYGATQTTHLPSITLGLSITPDQAIEYAKLYSFAHANPSSELAEALATHNLHHVHSLQSISSSPALMFGLGLIIIALGFKVGAAPMQLWIPDVYQGAPTPITSFLSVASKAAGFGVAITILRPFLAAESTSSQVALILVVLAGLTLLYGNLAALAQTNFKRLLAYSSIAHAGFLLIGLATSQFAAVSFYLATYLIMTFAAFFVLAIVRTQDDSDEIDTFNGLGKRNPLLAVALTIIMAAMAGVPLTAGFIGKFLMFEAAFSHLQTVGWLVISLAFLGAISGFYYYFKIIKAIYWHDPKSETPIQVPLISKLAITILCLAIILFGIIPQPIYALIQ
ncbi:NADH-quinone oxidoreductase subunit N [Rubritalea marina]|uniref:NADH-quinone oxidoreductase subunit N n=1 Tax=Rubritalea marina TaxID=361055 RepID=UPI0003647C3D|nr:NADH-quinone oxidoreductase subunit N [Rubritalea marina]